MAVLTKEELNQRLADRFGQTEDESDISFMEDITDTFANLETNANAEQLKDLQTRYSELQKKYRDRFFNTGDDSGSDDDVFKPTPDPEPKVLKFEDLFSQGD